MKDYGNGSREGSPVQIHGELLTLRMCDSPTFRSGSERGHNRGWLPAYGRSSGPWSKDPPFLHF